jgi:UrcA family protein
MLTKTTLTALAAFLALGSASVSQTASAETVSVKVRYHDLNLSTEHGAKIMLRRIKSAASEACGAQEYRTFPDHDYRPCVRDSTDRAVAQLASPMVTALNSGKSSSSPIAVASAR